MSRYLVGTDEAGYGPNLGPLVISATLWEIPAAIRSDQLYGRLPSVHAAPSSSLVGQPHVLIGDSKKLYHPGGGLGHLERGVLPSLALAAHGGTGGVLPVRWRQVWSRCDAQAASEMRRVPWFQSFDCPLPVDLASAELDAACQALAADLKTSGICLRAVQSRIVLPERFNGRVAHCGSKGQALSLWTLELIDRLVAPLESGPILIQCDKHGARNRYGALLQQVFPDYLIEVRQESKAQSIYRWGPQRRRLEIRFTPQGERFLPTALASMVSKYLRELAMRAFNDFWCSHQPELRPTAGYPVDAQRFRRDIRDLQRRLGIPDELLWRQR